MSTFLRVLGLLLFLSAVQKCIHATDDLIESRPKAGRRLVVSLLAGLVGFGLLSGWVQ